MAEEDQTQDTEEPPTRRRTCPNCGEPAEARELFCGQCGASLQRTCTNCGVSNSASYGFCGTCGALLAKPELGASVPAREQRCWVTALFAGVSGFTAISERIAPKDVKLLADEWSSELSEEIRRFGGTIVSVVGDEVYAVFGTPVAHEDDAERAVRAGLGMRVRKLSKAAGPPVRVHVGINTGEATAGWIGPEGRRGFTIMGHMVNTAARLMSTASAGSVVVGEETFRETRRRVSYRELPAIVAKGNDKPLAAWEALNVIATRQSRPLGTALLIGRDVELECLETIWRHVEEDSQPHLVTILGEPGAGKSRLVDEFERRLPAGVTILHGRCLPYQEGMGYWAFAQALKEAAGIAPKDLPRISRSKLEDLVSGVSSLEADPVELTRHLALLSGLELESDRLAGTGDQSVLHGSARRFLQAFARQHPLCLILDDLHWADDSLLDLIESLAARARGAPLLLMTKTRPELIERRGTWGRHVRSFTLMKLEAWRSR